MKKIFAFLFASALLATGLISCGGGGDDSDKYIVTGKQFEQGRGIGFIGASPAFYIMPTTDTSVLGGVKRPDRTGEEVEIPETSPAASSTILPEEGLTQEGREVIQRRTCQLTGGSSGTCDVSYLYTQQNYAIVTFSLSEAQVDTSAFINAFGLQQKVNNWSDSIDRFEVETLGGSNVQFVIDWNSGNAQVLVNVSVTGYETNDAGETISSGYVVKTTTVSNMTTRVIPYLEY